MADKQYSGTLGVEGALIIGESPNQIRIEASTRGAGLLLGGLPIVPTSKEPSFSIREKTKAAYAASATVTFSNAASTAIASGTTTFACLTGTGNTPSAGSNSPIITAVTGGPFTVGQGIAGPTGIPAGARIIAVGAGTVTMSANSAGTGTGVNLFTPNPNVPWRVGRIDIQPFSQYSTSGSIVPYSPTDLSQTPNRRGDRKFPYHIEFDFDGQAFEIVADQNAACNIRVWSNDLVSGDFSISATAATGFTKVDFGSVAYRRVCVETDGNLQLVGLRTSLTTTIIPPGSYHTQKFAILGDSFAVGAGINAAGQSHLDYASIMLRNLGFVNTRTYAVAGTGVVNTGGGIGAYISRINDVLTYAPDYVLVQGSINDTGQAGVQAATTSLLTALVAGLPTTATVVMFMVNAHTTTGPEATTDAQYTAAAQAVGVPYIDADSWINGTGTTGAPAGDGNADLYQSAIAANHPSTAGHAYAGRRLATTLAPLIGVGL